MSCRPMYARSLALAAVVAAMVLASLAGRAQAAAPSAGLTTVTAVMDWPVPWMGWSPWVVADELGYFRQEGIKLKVIEPATVADPAKVLGTGRADIAFTTILDVIEARAAGAPVTAVGAYAQSNTWGIITWKSQHLAPKDLKGKSIGVYPDAWSKTQLTLMLQHVGININQVKLVYTSDDTVPLLLTHKVDVITGVTNAEQTEAEISGKRPTTMYLAKDYGVPNSYIDVFAANDTFLKSHPDLARAWLRATRRGLTYALAHPTQTVSLFLKRYPNALAKDYALSSWNHTIPVFTSAATRAHGYFWQLPVVWQQTQDTLLSSKIIDQAVPVNQLFTNSYLQ